MQIRFLLRWSLNDSINLHLPVDKLDHFVNDFIAGKSKVFWRRIVGLYQSVYCLRKQRLLPAGVLHEVEEENLVEVGSYLPLIVEIKVIMKLGKL